MTLLHPHHLTREPNPAPVEQLPEQQTNNEPIDADAFQLQALIEKANQQDAEDKLRAQSSTTGMLADVSMARNRPIEAAPRFSLGKKLTTGAAALALVAGSWFATDGYGTQKDATAAAPAVSQPFEAAPSVVGQSEQKDTDLSDLTGAVIYNQPITQENVIDSVATIMPQIYARYTAIAKNHNKDMIDIVFANIYTDDSSQARLDEEKFNATNSDGMPMLGVVGSEYTKSVDLSEKPTDYKITTLSDGRTAIAIYNATESFEATYSVIDKKTGGFIPETKSGDIANVSRLPINLVGETNAEGNTEYKLYLA